MTTQYTPTPWQTDAKLFRCIYGSDKSDVAETYLQADAEFIVRACNAHATLVEALELITRECNALNKGPVAVEIARAALAKVA